MATASSWQTGVVTAIGEETPHAKTFRLRLAEPRTHRAGQFYVVRLTAPDGYHAQRDYSVASAPGGEHSRAHGREAAGRRGVGVPARRGRSR
ncbi:hypothetical protein [Amycolatopsis nalaikhensis]|uniref:FAD-binding FR-type domain-containing protein n=1 Tax=Amycolatopsis nalaikhensis TaxID=715472 RepID=A0ABY8XKZ9_9PSEU|nr:hypothetical protein [Amycolatopsis sp. 2-2]WIV56281.1 hypothetical protein QP939_47070 [Amycolatopsis sp. 2-2]